MGNCMGIVFASMSCSETRVFSLTPLIGFTCTRLSHLHRPLHHFAIAPNRANVNRRQSATLVCFAKVKRRWVPHRMRCMHVLGCEGGCMVCRRCRGLLIRETFDDLNIRTDTLYTAIRCINCGYIEDAVMRANRFRRLVETRGTLRGRGRTRDVECIKFHVNAYASI